MTASITVGIARITEWIVCGNSMKIRLRTSIILIATVLVDTIITRSTTMSTTTTKIMKSMTASITVGIARITEWIVCGNSMKIRLRTSIILIATVLVDTIIMRRTLGARLPLGVKNLGPPHLLRGMTSTMTMI